MSRRADSPVAHDRLIALVPNGPDWVVDWAKIWPLWPELERLDSCPQDAVHHAEGDVGTHTRMVVEALAADAEWRALPEDQRTRLFWAAVLHDIGKPAVTKHEADGRITSRGHSRIGAAMARELLYRVGSPIDWREALCGIIGAHQLPFFLIERPDAQRLVIETSWRCRADHLCLHALADLRGRISSNLQDVLDNVALARSLFEEADCLERPFRFGNDESRVAFFERQDRDPRFVAHEDFRCTVTVMSGLPGAGKDTWIARNRPELPVVSLDSIREELGIAARGNQGKVIQAARERAREYLRAGRDFAWNATNVSRQMRSKPLRLLRDYGARIEIVYLEVPVDRLLAQNTKRRDSVPVDAIEKLMQKLEPPQLLEAHQVDWIVDGIT